MWPGIWTWEVHPVHTHLFLPTPLASAAGTLHPALAMGPAEAYELQEAST